MIRTTLLKHQRLAVDFMDNKPYTGIFSDFGTGKSLIALAHIDQQRYHRSLIVSTKTSIQATWTNEIRQHTDLRYVELIGTRSQKLSALTRGIRLSSIASGYYHRATKTPTLFLINFDGVESIFQELVAVKFDCLILDESTKIKDKDTRRTKVLWAFGRTVNRRAILSGFPITESLSDLYAQIKFLDHGEAFGNSYYKFMDEYFVKFGYRYAPKKKKIPQLLEKIKPFCVRITGDVLKLPPKRYRTIKLQLTEQQDKLLTEFNEMFRLEFGKVKIDTQYIFTLLNKSLQVTDGFIQDQEGNLEVVETNKDVALLETLDEIDPRKDKVLIWCAFRHSVAKIERLITKLRGWPVVTLTGSTADTNTVVQKFQHAKTNILVASLKKASASITLTNCKYAIYYSNLWSYDERYNSEARIYRKGSEKHPWVMYIDLLTANSVEAKVYQCLRTKKNLVDELKESFRGALSQGED